MKEENEREKREGNILLEGSEQQGSAQHIIRREGVRTSYEYITDIEETVSTKQYANVVVRWILQSQRRMHVLRWKDVIV